jgi:DNA-binding IclR family transcriptional regulator
VELLELENYSGAVLSLKPRQSPDNRSLQRGLAILLAFKPGSTILGNADLAERVELPRSTVSRLTQTLVGMGMLQIEPYSRAYCLAPAVLTLAHAMRSGSSILSVAAPLMHTCASAHKINVGLAAADGEEMVYLESIRYHPRPSLRSVVSGQRVPIALTSLGRAHMAGISQAEQRLLFARLSQSMLSHAKPSRWRDLKTSIQAAILQVEQFGFCATSWQPEVVAIATPLTYQDRVYALNISVSTKDSLTITAKALSPHLLALKRQLLGELATKVGLTIDP